MAEASEFKFGIELGFAKSNYKITRKYESGRGFRLDSLKNLGFPLIFTQIGHVMVLLQHVAWSYKMAEVAMAVPNKQYYIKMANRAY